MDKKLYGQKTLDKKTVDKKRKKDKKITKKTSTKKEKIQKKYIKSTKKVQKNNKTAQKYYIPPAHLVWGTGGPFGSIIYPHLNILRGRTP